MVWRSMTNLIYVFKVSTHLPFVIDLIESIIFQWIFPLIGWNHYTMHLNDLSTLKGRLPSYIYVLISCLSNYRSMSISITTRHDIVAISFKLTMEIYDASIHSNEAISSSSYWNFFCSLAKQLTTRRIKILFWH